MSNIFWLLDPDKRNMKYLAKEKKMQLYDSYKGRESFPCWGIWINYSLFFYNHVKHVYIDKGYNIYIIMSCFELAWV